MKPGVDQKCVELAEHFLNAEARGTKADEPILDLAQAVQEAVENWFRSNDKAVSA